MTFPFRKTMTARTTRYLVAPGPQLRFIVFLLVLLIAYTVLLRVFQKLARMLDLPVLLPAALIALLVFVAVAGLWYSHKFLGPLRRITRVVERWNQGGAAVELKLREADDPLLIDLANELNDLSERQRNAAIVIREAAEDLSAAREGLSRAINKNASTEEVNRSLGRLREKEEILRRAIGPGKA